MEINTNHQKIVIFSDTHLTSLFNERIFQFLKKNIEKADVVMLLGDFWDAWLTSWNDFITSPWRDRLFPLLQKKATLYFYGNHDHKKYITGQDTPAIFCQESHESLEISIDGIKYLILHGNTISPAYDERFNFPNFRLGGALASTREYLGNKFVHQLLMQHYSQVNKKFKKYIQKNNLNLICGHSHFQEHSTEPLMINPGFTRFNYGQCVHIQNKKISLINEGL